MIVFKLSDSKDMSQAEVWGKMQYEDLYNQPYLLSTTNAKYVDNFKFVIQIEIEWVSSNYPGAAKDYTVSIYHDKRNELYISQYKEDSDGKITKGYTKEVKYDGASPSGFLNPITSGLGAFTDG